MKFVNIANISGSMALDANTGACKSVWVGNVNAEVVTEAELQQLFVLCGKIESVKVFNYPLGSGLETSYSI